MMIKMIDLLQEKVWNQ